MVARTIFQPKRKQSSKISSLLIAFLTGVASLGLLACGPSDSEVARYRAAFKINVAQGFVDGFEVQELKPSEELCIHEVLWESIGRSLMSDLPLAAMEADGSELDDRNLTADEFRDFTDRLARTDCLDWEDLYRRTPYVSAAMEIFAGTPTASAFDCYISELVSSDRWEDLLFERYAANAQRLAAQPAWVEGYLFGLADSCKLDRDFLTRRS